MLISYSQACTLIPDSHLELSRSPSSPTHFLLAFHSAALLPSCQSIMTGSLFLSRYHTGRKLCTSEKKIWTRTCRWTSVSSIEGVFQASAASLQFYVHIIINTPSSIPSCLAPRLSLHVTDTICSLVTARQSRRGVIYSVEPRHTTGRSSIKASPRIFRHVAYNYRRPRVISDLLFKPHSTLLFNPLTGSRRQTFIRIEHPEGSITGYSREQRSLINSRTILFTLPLPRCVEIGKSCMFIVKLATSLWVLQDDAERAQALMQLFQKSLTRRHHPSTCQKQSQDHNPQPMTRHPLLPRALTRSKSLP